MTNHIQEILMHSDKTVPRNPALYLRGAGFKSLSGSSVHWGFACCVQSVEATV